MTPSTPWRADLVTLARPAVAAAAPAELPLLPATVEAASRRLGSRVRASRSEDMLGFGWDESVPVVTVAAIGAAQAVLGFLAAQAGEALREEASGAVRERVRGLLRRLRGAPPQRSVLPAEPLTADQLRRIRAVALDRALGAGLDGSRAELVADAIVGRLAASDDDRE